MIVKKQYIPKRYRSKKLVNSGGGMVVGGSSASGSAVDTSAFLLADKFTSLFEYDEVNDAIKAKLPFYSEGEISAYGYGGSGGGGGTGIVYNGLDSVITDIALSAYMGNVLNTNKLDVSTFNSWVANYVPPAPAWGDITGKPSTFPATAHVHGWGEIENKPTTFAPSAHTHTWASIESKPNVITGTTASFTTALETKLNGIESGANNYTHPATHSIAEVSGLQTALDNKVDDGQVLTNVPAGALFTDTIYTHPATHAPSIIAQDTNNRFVTDTNIADWNKAYYDIEGLEIGGMNLVRNSLVNETSSEYGFADRTVDLTEGQQYTFSFKGMASGSATLMVYLFYPDYSMEIFPYIETNSTTEFIGKKTFTSPVTATGCHCRAYALGGSVTLNWYKIEKGNKATDWSPAPEDHISDWLTTDVNSFSYIKNKPTTLSGYGIASTDTMFDSKYLGISANAVSATKLVNARTIAGTSFDGTANINISYNNLTNLPSLAFLPLSGGTMTGNLTMGLTTDIITNFKTWTKDNSKSLKSFLNKFDIDANGNLVVLTNLYSTGEVTAYSSGTGVSGLTLQGNLNANNYDIYSAKSISVGDMKFGYVGDKMGLHEEITDATIAAFDENDYNYYFADNKLIYDNTNNIFSVTGQVVSSEFKFGNYSFKQSANGLSICYNGVEQAYITNTGQYVNS